MRLSNTLKPSSKYSKAPNARSFSIISIEKIQLNTRLLISRALKNMIIVCPIDMQVQYLCKVFWLIMMF